MSVFFKAFVAELNKVGALVPGLGSSGLRLGQSGRQPGNKALRAPAIPGAGKRRQFR